MITPGASMSKFNVELHRHSSREPWTYALLDKRQREIAAEVRQGAPGRLLLSEVAPVITLGRRATRAELTLAEPMLKAKGIEVYPTDRGGLATYHGPGQWVLFVVDSLERLTGDPRGVKQAVQGLLESLLETARIYDAPAEIRGGLETGVWTKRGKVGAVGVHVEEGVLLHGLSLNGFKTETSFLGLKPCGLEAPVDFLLKGESEFERLGEQLKASVQKRFSAV